MIKALWVAVLLLGASKEPSIFPALDHDSRLNRVVTMEVPKESMAAFVERLHKLTGVEFVVQGDWLNKPVALQVTDRSVRAILTDLGISIGGSWVKRGDAYLLLDRNLSMMAQQGMGVREMDYRTRQLLNMLSKQQMAYLKAGNVLTYQQLGKDQQRWVSAIVAVEVAMHPDRHYVRTLGGEGVILRLVDVKRDPSLSIQAPRVWPGGEQLTQFADVPLNRP